jgi:hypothetical protein
MVDTLTRLLPCFASTVCNSALGLLLDLGTQQHPVWFLQSRLGTPAVLRAQVLPGPLQSEHLFDKRHPDTKEVAISTSGKSPCSTAATIRVLSSVGYSTISFLIPAAHTLENRYKCLYNQDPPLHFTDKELATLPALSF